MLKIDFKALVFRNRYNHKRLFKIPSYKAYMDIFQNQGKPYISMVTAIKL